MTLGCHDVSCTFRNVELVLNHDCLSHEVHDFVRVNELCLLLQVKDPWEDTMLKTVLQDEVTTKMVFKKRLQSALHLFA